MIAAMLVVPKSSPASGNISLGTAPMSSQHQRAKELFLAALDRPSTATECSAHLFDRKLVEGQWLLTLAETLAHLHRLVTLGEVRREVDANGRISFARA